METKRISEKEIEGMPVLATGYKMFKNDWTTKHGKYDYKDEKGNVLGSIHKVEGDLEECACGLHFSKLPHDCFNFYESVQWNKFAKVEAYKECIDSEDGEKSVASIIKIVEIYSFDEFINLIQEELQNSYGVNDSYGVYYSKGVNDSFFCKNITGVSKCILCSNLEGAKLKLFNKKTTESRFNEVKNKLIGFGWYPKFNNAEELRGNLEWYEANIPAIVKVENKTAYSFMPKDMVDYIKNLPEFNEKIFDEIFNK
jgi:hypothetical protein